VSAAGLGLLVSWLVDTFTAVQMPDMVAQVVGAIILGVLAWMGGMLGGYAKPSELSAASSSYRPRYAERVHNTLTAEQHGSTDAGHGDIGLLRGVVIVVVVIILVILVMRLV
jgi:hypothetical protein